MGVLMLKLPLPSKLELATVVQLLSGSAMFVEATTLKLPPGVALVPLRTRFEPLNTTLEMYGCDTTAETTFNVPSTVRLLVSHNKLAPGAAGTMAENALALYVAALKSWKLSPAASGS